MDYRTHMLAVWEGARPRDDAAGGQVFQQLYGRYVRQDQHDHRESWQPPTERIAEYVAALLQRWPDATGEDDVSPWESGLAGNGTGPLIYFGLRWDAAEEVSAYAAQLAASMGLVCFDVSQGKVRP